MAFNQVENAILAHAIQQLEPQYTKHGSYSGQFYLGTDVRFMVIPEGPDKGRLTVARHVVAKEWTPDPRITPVDCYNLMMEGEAIADAVRRLTALGHFENRAASLDGHFDS